MKTKLGIFLMCLGSACIVAALGLFLYNEQQQKAAEEFVAEIMPQIVEVIHERQQELQAEDTSIQGQNISAAGGENQEMTEVEINGEDYIGFLWIPAIDLELPVMGKWSYKRLRVSPCRYSGSLYTDDLVILAHNHDNFFARLSELRAGDIVTFTDMNAVVHAYEVIALDILETTDVDEMKSGEYDLTLFTCTYTGTQRIAVRCDRMSE